MMNPSRLDESLLTAYLDNELSESERQLVEDQLKVDDRWKQLLAELEIVRKLIQELPKPLLSRSFADGPWNEATSASAIAVRRESTKEQRTRIKTLFALLALAASIAICGVGAFAWMRFGNRPNEIAKLEPKSNNSESIKGSLSRAESSAGVISSTDEPGLARSGEVVAKSRVESHAGGFSKAADSNSKSELAKTQQQQVAESTNLPPSPSPSAPLPEGGARGASVADDLVRQDGAQVPGVKDSAGESAAARTGMARDAFRETGPKGEEIKKDGRMRSMAPMPGGPKQESETVALSATEDFSMVVPLPSSESSRYPEPVATYFATQTDTIADEAREPKTAGKLSVDKAVEADGANLRATMPLSLTPIPNSGESTTIYVWRSHGAKPSESTPVESLRERRYEIRLQYSDLKDAVQVLRESGLEVTIENATSEDLLELSKSKAVSQSRSVELNDFSARRPPTLKGAITEETDWIRIVIDRD